MCDTVLSCARDHLLPLARDHLLPLLKEAADMIMGIPKEIVEIKDELGRIEEFISNADRVADADENNKSQGTRGMINQLIEATFRIEDVIDDYMICEEQQLPDPGCAAGAANCFKTMSLRLQIAYKIQNIKSRINEIRDTSIVRVRGFQINSSSEQGASSSGVNSNTILLQNLRKAPFYMDEADVVGFEEPKNLLIDWLVRGRKKRTVVSVVAMGGQGKTTLAKKVFDNPRVVKHFDCHVWITVSQQYNAEGLLREMLHKLYKEKGNDLPKRINQMDRDSLVGEVRNCLQQQRYVVVFDDVWNICFWDEIDFAMIDNKNSCKIIITTRNMNVVNACKKSSFVEVHELKPLTKEKSLELFNKKAFYDLNGRCPENLVDISSKIVEKCYGLPLAIVVTGGLLSCKDRNTIEWYKFNENIKPELKEDSKIKKILALSYHDLPYNLKLCLLYFGLYPEDYIVTSKTLNQQWIAEGYVKEERGKTLEEVAEGYLIELTHRSLIQVSTRMDGTIRGCHVHDMVRAMILEKCEDLSFCNNISDEKQSPLTGMVRRLSITDTNSDNLMKSIENSQVRSLLVLTSKTLNESFVSEIPTKFRRLKVLLLLDDGFLEVPENLGSLSHLKYLRLWGRGRTLSLPKSIGMLENLETLDLSSTKFNVIPKDICKLRKLRHFLGFKMSLIQLKDDIGDMTSLQTLRDVCLGEEENEDEIDERVVKLIQEMGKLKQLRELVLLDVRGKYMSVISSSINEMQKMEKLSISTIGHEAFIDMDLNSPPPLLRNVKLNGKLKNFPEWISKLQNLAKLKVQLMYSKQTDDLTKLLKSMPSLLSLYVSGADDDEGLKGLYFLDGWFKNLKRLYVENFHNSSYIDIDKGALGSLKALYIVSIPQLKMLPTGIQHLQKLEVLNIRGVSEDFMKTIAPDEGKEHWIYKLVPSVKITPS
ncbi:disease resistance protein RPM1-like [Trifolium pratense]|uniref:disease resistance protein RPM1-like n=1 Tax=Trifolium pratense TaxID=57577 RepID=UPI001E692E3F|nr:disease resistance protein RPM1-like [Trifolium pratense]